KVFTNCQLNLVSETLKRFAVKVTTSSVKERREILSELGRCITGKDLPEGAVKGLCKLFCLTLHRYRDAASHRALQTALRQLAECQPEVTAKNLLYSLQSSGISSNKSSGSAASLALSWTCLLVRIVFRPFTLNRGWITGSPSWSFRTTIEPPSFELSFAVHEGTLVHAISILALWCGRFVTEVPKTLVEWFKKAFSLKACTSAVRHAYLQCMLASFKGNVLLQGSEMLPLLIQTVEKAGAQSTQIPLVTEGVAAALLICRLSVADAQIENKLNSFWQLILDEKKQIFTSEKFLQSASEEVMCTVLQLTERLLLDHECRLPGAKIQQYYKALTAVLLSRSWSVRRLAQQTVRKLLSLPRGFKLACGLLEELKAVLVSHKVLPPEALVTESGELSEQGKTYIPPRILQEALCVIACGPGMEGELEEKEKLVLEMLLVSSHPSLGEPRGRGNERGTLDPRPSVSSLFSLLQSSLNAVGLLSVLLPAKVLPQLISTISASLGNPALCLVTQEEFAIMKMPEGELYDKSILHSAQQDSLKKANMKRENKAYSFKEQIIELELKEEIKKKKGIKEEIQLTSKQKEMLTAQLEKESQMRKQLKELDTELESTLGLFDAVLKRNPPSLSQYIPALVGCFLPLLKSPLAAPRIKAPFLSLVSCVMPDHLKTFGTVASHVTLRMMKPECDLDESWCQEDLPTAVNRVIGLLHTHTVPTRITKGEEGPAPLSAPAFSLVFPLLKMVLLETPNDSEEKEELLVKVLQIITVHAQLRSPTNDENWLVDENGPELLPRTDMLLLLTKVIGTGSPRVQVLGSVALTALCASSSGEDGCAYAEQEEINVLLQALQSPCMNVRDAALRGLMELQMVLPTPDSDEKNGMNLLRRLWVVKFDREEEIRMLAERLWVSMALELQPDICSILIQDVIHHEQAVRQAGAEALSKGVEQYRSQTKDVMAKLMGIYQEKLYRPPPVLDALGRVILESPPDQWEARCGIALALNKLSQHLESSQVKPLFEFFVPDALNDRHPEVRKCMLDAALSALNTHGKPFFAGALKVFPASLFQVLCFSDSLVPTVRKALCDPLEELHSTIGFQALEDILPFLLKQLECEETSDFALDGLKQVMAVKSRVVLPYLVPKLISPPVNTRVLAFLSSVAGDALTRHLGVILPAMMSALKEKLGTSDEQQEMLNCQAVILSVEDEAGQRIIIEDLLDTTRSAEVGRRQAAAVILNIYCSKTKADYTAHLRNLVSGLIRLFNDTNAVVLNESWDALNAISKKLDAGSQLALIDDLHRKSICCLICLSADHMSALSPSIQGVTSILPMLREGVLTGNSDQKEEAAKALGLVIKLTSAEALKPSVVSITGPLIRILGDRFSWNVKVALLETLSLLLAKVGLALKPFLPQLQTTFTKALQDPNRVVRLKAAEALGKLIAIHAKVDPLFTELLNGIRTSEDSGIRDTMLQALRFVTQGAGGKVDAAVRKSIISMLLSMLGHEEDATRMTSAGCLAEMCAFLTDDELGGVLQNHLLADVSGIDWMVRHGRSLALSVAVNTAASRLCAPKYSNSVHEMIFSNTVADRIPIAVSGIRGMGFLMKHHIEANGGNLPPKLSNLFIKCLQNPSSDIKLIAEKMIWWANKAPLLPLDPPVAKPILKALLDNTKDKNTSVRAYSDQAIVNLLKMRDGEETVQSVSKILDAASLELLNESCRRSLKKLANQADSVEQIDDTLLT
uniref:GCN1 activator of EIF2AK4 n=1 Tax=Naja naja TaxID=35670 RepID=A0A8C6YI46_NAJNA